MISKHKYCGLVSTVRYAGFSEQCNTKTKKRKQHKRTTGGLKIHIVLWYYFVASWAFMDYRSNISPYSHRPVSNI